MLRVLLLDLMDVLVHDPYREALRAGTGQDVLTAHRFSDREAWPLFEVAAIDEAEFARRFAAGAGHFDLAAFNRTRRAGYRWLPGMRELVVATRGRLERHVASNYPVWIEQVRHDLGLDDLVEGVWASHHLGVRKPDTRFFARILAAIGADPADCLFVDDREVNVQAALAVGLRAHLFAGAGGVVRRLAEEGVDLGCNLTDGSRVVVQDGPAPS
jgi:FMN hydrolase / 5-amino-6-(5-phospho-D-ribitylamino)uracil phosphatase